MNPTLLKDLILAGHRVACKTHEWNRAVLLFLDWDGYFQWTIIQHSIEASLSIWIGDDKYDTKWLNNFFTWEYKIVTPLPQLPQVWDTVEVLDICRELPRFYEREKSRRDMVWRKFTINEHNSFWDIWIWSFYFTSRQVAKCEPEKAQSIQSEEKFWDTIVLNWRTYKSI